MTPIPSQAPLASPGHDSEAERSALEPAFGETVAESRTIDEALGTAETRVGDLDRRARREGGRHQARLRSLQELRVAFEKTAWSCTSPAVEERIGHETSLATAAFSPDLVPSMRWR